MSTTVRTTVLGGALLALALAVPSAPVYAKGDEPTRESTRATAFQSINSAPLRINVGADLSFQIFNSAVPGVGQIFPNNATLADMGWLVRNGATLYAPDWRGRPSATGALGAITAFGAVAQDPVSGSGTTASPFTVVTRVTAGTLQLRETVRYESGKGFFNKALEVTNPGASPVDVTVYLGSDIYLASSDAGKPARIVIPGGTSITGTGGRTCPGVNPVYNILHIPLVAPDRFSSDGFAAIWGQIGAGTLPNTINPANCIDNGAALQWNLTIDAGASSTLEVLTSFGEIPVLTAGQYAPPLMANEGQYVPPHGSHGVYGAIAANVDGDPQLELVATAGKNSIDNANSIVVMDQDVSGRWYPNRRLFLDGTGRVHLARPTHALPFPPVVTLDNSRTVRLYGEQPLRETSRFVIAEPLFDPPNEGVVATIQDVRIADLDLLAPGPELLVCVTGPSTAGSPALASIRAYNLATQTRVLSIQTTDCRALEVAQLDADPALEILAIGRQSRIFDSVTRLSQWLYQFEFPFSYVAVGNLNSSPGLDFVLAAPGLPTRLFSGTVPQVFGEIPVSGFSVSSLALSDINGDGRDELILGTGGSNKVQIYDTTNLSAPLREIDKTGLAVSHLVVANFDSDAAPEAWWVSDILTTTADKLVLADLASGEIQVRQEDVIGPIHVAGPAQLDNDPDLDLAVVSTTGNAGFNGATAFIYSADSGLLKRSFRLFRDPITQQGLTVTALELAQLDGTGPLELVASGQGFANFAMGFDGLGVTRWYVEQTPETPIGFALPRGMVIADTNADGIDDVLLHTDAPGGLFELNGANGAIRWRVPPTSELPSGLAIAQLDADASLELVAAYTQTQTTVAVTRIYDLATKELERLIEVGGALSGVLISQPRASRELLFLDPGNFGSSLRAYNLDTDTQREWFVPFLVNLVEPRPFTDGRFFIAGNGRLFLMDWNAECMVVDGELVCEEPQYTQRSTFLDLEIGFGSEIRVTPFLNAREERHVYVGGQGAVWRARFQNILMSDGFEAPTPTP
ncbi:MAG: hypothetical protein MUE46_16770 [Xanthomonadales bacterium]|jgi:hypothetical protein|nr:hypothetical protein [Xanthomonadales bacterium]